MFLAHLRHAAHSGTGISRHDLVDAEACQRLRATIKEDSFLDVAPRDELEGALVWDLAEVGPAERLHAVAHRGEIARRLEDGDEASLAKLRLLQACAERRDVLRERVGDEVPPPEPGTVRGLTFLGATPEEAEGEAKAYLGMAEPTKNSPAATSAHITCFMANPPSVALERLFGSLRFRVTPGWRQPPHAASPLSEREHGIPPRAVAGNLGPTIIGHYYTSF